jgi:RNA polymerase sigma-70 factor, ECF subfamily
VPVMPSDPLATAFVAGLAEPVRSRLDAAALAPQLAAAVAEGAAAWPRLRVEPARFAAHLAGCVSERADAARPLAALHVRDLYLACACAGGAPRAAETLEAECFAVVEPALARLSLDAAAIEEARQILRKQLLVAEPGRPPLIASYGGRGPLAAWVRVVALRIALKLQQRGRRELPVEERVLEAMPLQESDAELGYIKELYRGEFQAAFAEALRALPPREQNLLLHHYLDGLTTRELAALHRVNQSTAARWLEQARQQVLEATREGLERRLGAESAEVESIMRLVHSRLEVTLRGLLGR